jgi:hypothetical protein
MPSGNPVCGHGGGRGESFQVTSQSLLSALIQLQTPESNFSNEFEWNRLIRNFLKRLFVQFKFAEVRIVERYILSTVVKTINFEQQVVELINFVSATYMFYTMSVRQLGFLQQTHRSTILISANWNSTKKIAAPSKQVPSSVPLFKLVVQRLSTHFSWR